MNLSTHIEMEVSETVLKFGPERLVSDTLVPGSCMFSRIAIGPLTQGENLSCLNTIENNDDCVLFCMLAVTCVLHSVDSLS